MKTRILILSSVLCLYGAFNANASECTGAGCDIEPLTFEEFDWTVTSDVPAGETPTAIIVAKPTPVAPPPPT